MHKFFVFFLSLFFVFLFAAEAPNELEAMLKKKSGGAENPELIVVHPADRAKDLKAAFEYLKKEKIPNRVMYKLRSGESLSGISEVTVLPGGTMLIFKLMTPAGTKFRVIPVEDVESINI